MSHLWATINRGWLTYIFRWSSALPHTKRKNLYTGRGLRHEASPADQRACFYLLREIHLKGPPLLLVFYTASLFLQVPLVPSTYGYHLYPPNPKGNVASSFLKYFPHQVKYFCYCLHIMNLSKRVAGTNESKSGKALLAHILGLMILSNLIPARVAQTLKPISHQMNQFVQSKNETRFLLQLPRCLICVFALDKQIGLMQNRLYALKLVNSERALFLPKWTRIMSSLSWQDKLRLE